MGSAIAEAQRTVKEQVVIPVGYTLKWTGDFENQQRASKRLGQVVPVSIAIIFIILFMLFGNARDAGLVLFNVPFAAVGGIAALLMTGFNFSISAGIGFIALFGICIQNGVIMLMDFKQNIRQELPLQEAIATGVRSRMRAVIMTADGCHRFGSGSPFARYRFRIAASAGYRHYRRLGSRYLLHAVRLSVDRGGRLQPGILHERGKTSRAESVK